MIEVPKAEDPQMLEQPKADTHEWNWKRTTRNAVLVGVLAFAPRSDAPPPIPVLDSGSGQLTASTYEVKPPEGHVVVVYGQNPVKVDGENSRFDVVGVLHEVVFGCGDVDVFARDARIHIADHESEYYTSTTTPHPERRAKEELQRQGCPDPDIKIH